MNIVSVEISNTDPSGLYGLLQVNDESSIESKGTSSTEIRAVAKVLYNQTGSTTIVTEATGLVSYPITFRNPQDFTVLRVRLVNSNGTIVNCDVGANLSFTLELTEVMNSYLYESNRKHIGYDPANVRS
jgi:hypothetical protein